MELADEPPRALRDAFRGRGGDTERCTSRGFNPCCFLSVRQQPPAPARLPPASPPALSSPPCLRSAPAQGQYKQHYLCLAKHSLITHERAHAPDDPRHPPTAIKHSLKACYLILTHLSLSEDILKINKSASDLHMHSS